MCFLFVGRELNGNSFYHFEFADEKDKCLVCIFLCLKNLFLLEFGNILVANGKKIEKPWKNGDSFVIKC